MYMKKRFIVFSFILLGIHGLSWGEKPDSVMTDSVLTDSPPPAKDAAIAPGTTLPAMQKPFGNMSTQQLNEERPISKTITTTEKIFYQPPGTTVKPVELSSIEKTLLEDAPRVPKPQQFSSGRISQFGYSFFRPDSAGFAPLTDIPVGPDYIVGAGDRIVLTVDR